MTEAEIAEACVAEYAENKHRLKLFKDTVVNFFIDHPRLGGEDVVHSVRSRLKDEKHLYSKVLRKNSEGRGITPENLFTIVNDLAGVRVLHLHHSQFPIIHSCILRSVEDRDWYLAEAPKAFSWDPESEQFFRSIGLETEIRSTFYTSIHYLVRPNADSPLCCEIQVRTLFEEVWGEIDHLLNYPTKSNSVACKEQLRVLAKLVGTGTRLVDAIVRSHEEYCSLSGIATPKG